MINKNLQGIICTLCSKNAELEHHIDYKRDITIPVCSKCHTLIHAAAKNPAHYKKTKYFKYIPIDGPRQINFVSTQKEWIEIKNIDRKEDFSHNIRYILRTYLDYKTLMQLRIGKYHLTLRKLKS